MNDLNLSKYNIFIHGFVDKKILVKYYLSSSGIICLGYDETFCLNAIEAFACGLPIITFGYTALSELINTRNSIKINNFDELSNSINFIYDFNKTRRKKFINSCVKFSQKFTINRVGNIWLKTLKLNSKYKDILE